jgi:hypothetical protein
VTFVPQKTNIACFKHNGVETNCSKVGVIGNAVTGFYSINISLLLFCSTRVVCLGTFLYKAPKLTF